MKTVASIFGGFGGFEFGAMAAGLTPLWTVENDPAIAAVYERNIGRHAVVARAQDVDYSTLARADWLHTSQQCTNASAAKQNGGETEEDISQARAVARALTTLRPPEYSMENVWRYRTFKSFDIILEALKENGYQFAYWHLNAADYGVPQTRQRLILLASRQGRPHRPAATHSKRGDLFTAPWVGWYAAIEDLVPTLPESKFAPWQLKRLPAHFTGSFAVDSFNSSHAGILRDAAEPFTADNGTGRLNPTRAFIVGGKPANYAGDLQITDHDEPVVTVTASQTRHPFRAFIVGQNYGSPNDNGRERVLNVRDEAEPVFTIETNPNRLNTRARLSQGHVVKMTPRALARFQSIPDTVELPDSNGLACKVIGNAVPSLLARRIVESRLEAVRRAA